MYIYITITYTKVYKYGGTKIGEVSHHTTFPLLPKIIKRNLYVHGVSFCLFVNQPNVHFPPFFSLPIRSLSLYLYFFLLLFFTHTEDKFASLKTDPLMAPPNPLLLKSLHTNPNTSPNIITRIHMRVS